MCFIAKLLLWGFNVSCTMAGVIIIIIGVLAQINGYHVQPVLDGQLSLVSILFMVIGSIVIAVSFLGCYAVMKESKFLLVAYASTLILILILQLIIGIMASIYASNLKGNIEERIEREFSNYDKYKEKLDELQYENKCCGADGKNKFVTELPPPCCGFAPSEPSKGVNCTTEKAYDASCKEVVHKIVSDEMTKVAFTALILILVEIACIILAFCVRYNVDEEDD